MAIQTRVGVVLIALLLGGLPTVVSAHDASTYVIILRSDGPMPTNVTEALFTNDLVMFRNVDATESITQRILLDGDGDGAYNNSSVDWDSGPLDNECELDELGNKTDAGCKVTYIIAFNETGQFGVGLYNYQVESSNDKSFNGSIRVQADFHTDSAPDRGYTFGNDEGGNNSENTATAAESDPLAAIGGTQTLLVFSALTALAALGVLARIGRDLNQEIESEKASRRKSRSADK